MIKIGTPIQIKRKTNNALRHHPKMGALSTQVTTIKKTFLGIPFKTLHKYRETYSGKVKDCEACNPAILR